MPPRYAYWTILIDDKPTAFRAREREELLPTFVQLQRKNTSVTMQWFARGRLWASREAERNDFQMRKHAAAAPRDRRADRPEGSERRGGDWRPGGTHKDPRDRFKKKNRPERAWSEKDPATQRDRDKPGYAASKPRGARPWSKKPDVAQAEGARKPWTGKPRERKPWNKPAGSAPQGDRPWQTKPTGPRAQRKPWVGKPPGDTPRGDRPREPRRSSSDPQTSGGGWSSQPPGGDRRPWSGKSPNKSGVGPGRGKPGVAQGFLGSPKRDERKGGSPAKPREPKPWSSKPPGSPPQGDRPWSAKPPADGGKRPWSGKPRDQNRTPFAPRGPQSGGPPADGASRKRRDDEPPDRG